MNEHKTELFCNFGKLRYLCIPQPEGLPPLVPVARRKHASPDGGIGRRAGLKHQWSNPCRFDPGSGYDKTLQVIDFQCSQGFSFLPKPQKWSLLVTAMQKITSEHLKIY